MLLQSALGRNDLPVVVRALQKRGPDFLVVYPAGQFPNFRGGKFSKSRSAVVDLPYFLSKYEPDALHLYLTAVAPETRDTEFYWENFVERNNNELMTTRGELANRMLSLTYKRFDGKVPEPGELDDEERAS